MPTLVSKQVSVRQLTIEEMPLLEQMYATFAPPEVAMGLPPADPERRRKWLDGLTSGVNFVAVIEDRFAGHLALMPSEHAAEMAVFVHQDFRRRGVATAVVNAAVELCRAKHFRCLWVLISSDNNAARTGLLNYGFHTAWESMGQVRMEFAL